VRSARAIPKSVTRMPAKAGKFTEGAPLHASDQIARKQKESSMHKFRKWRF